MIFCTVSKEKSYARLSPGLVSVPKVGEKNAKSVVEREIMILHIVQVILL